jgi:hypothetical protein
MTARPVHQRLLLATYLTCGWILVVIFEPVFEGTRDLVVIATLGAFGVAFDLLVVSLVSLAVDRRLPPMRGFPNLQIDGSCWVAGVGTAIALMVVSVIGLAILNRSGSYFVRSFFLAVPFWAASMAFLLKARPVSNSKVEH